MTNRLRSFAEAMKTCAEVYELYTNKDWFVNTEVDYSTSNGGFYIRLDVKNKTDKEPVLTTKNGFIVKVMEV